MATTPEQKVPGWRNVLWRACRHSDDDEFAGHIFSAVSRQPLGWRGIAVISAVGALYGALIALLVVLLKNHVASLSSTFSWKLTPLPVALGAAGGGLLALLFVGLPTMRVTWRSFLSSLAPEQVTLDWGGLFLSVLLFFAFSALLMESAADAAFRVILMVVPFGFIVLLLTVSGGGLLSGFRSALISGVAMVALFGVAGGAEGYPEVGFARGFLGLLICIVFSIPAGVLASVLGGRLIDRHRTWRWRRYWFWWPGNPLAHEVEEALQQGSREDRAVRKLWAAALAQLARRKNAPERLALLIADLDNESWVERFAARHTLVFLGGRSVRLLRPIATEGRSLHGDTAMWILESIAQDTTRRLARRVNRLLCPHCLVRFAALPISVPGPDLTYYGCRTCGQSHEVLEWPGEVVAVLDEGMKEEEETVTEGNALRVNWLTRRELFDFDRVEIVQASDEEVERFAVQVGNDVDPLRKARYQKVAWYVESGCSLTENTRRILGRAFGPMEDSP